MNQHKFPVDIFFKDLTKPKVRSPFLAEEDVINEVTGLSDRAVNPVKRHDKLGRLEQIKKQNQERVQKKRAKKRQKLKPMEDLFGTEVDQAFGLNLDGEPKEKRPKPPEPKNDDMIDKEVQGGLKDWEQPEFMQSDDPFPKIPGADGKAITDHYVHDVTNNYMEAVWHQRAKAEVARSATVDTAAIPAAKGWDTKAVENGGDDVHPQADGDSPLAIENSG